MTVSTGKPLRKDAERNRKLILDAAMDLFASEGLGVTLNDIAHHAGVGVGTVYRRFPDREQLIETLFEEKVEEMAGLMEAAVADPDPWRGLTGFFERSLELQAQNLALKDLILGADRGHEHARRIRQRLTPLGEQLVRRAQDAGELRADAAATDLPMFQLMLGVLIDGTQAISPELWRRYLAIMLQGMRANPDPPAALEDPPLPAGDVETAMSAARLRRR